MYPAKGKKTVWFTEKSQWSAVSISPLNVNVNLHGTVISPVHTWTPTPIGFTHISQQALREQSAWNPWSTCKYSVIYGWSSYSCQQCKGHVGSWQVWWLWASHHFIPATMAFWLLPILHMTTPWWMPQIDGWTWWRSTGHGHGLGWHWTIWLQMPCWTQKS